MADISVTELKERLDKGEHPRLIDVREPHEHQLGHLDGSELIPMAELPVKLEELATLKDQEVILYCRSGGRSGAMTTFMTSNGFKNVRNLAGGMLAWQKEIDPALQV
jgi:rhodanese-related sulfurtransferase